MPFEIFFATGNKNKFDEAKLYLERNIRGLILKQLTGDFPEIQAGTLEEVARFKILAATKQCTGNIFMEDAGLFIPVLNGFPGVYSSQVKKMLDCKGILKLMEEYKSLDKREAYFEACDCLFMPASNEFKTFSGRIDGTIAFEERGKNGFGFDPIFVANEPRGNKKTFAEMTNEDKIQISHRSRALQKLKDFIVQQRKLPA
nr:RdgB/HAM1 family non-canonical purine NTP pyrophosphatase [Candidatus Sigynarchaeota archaeon]